MINHELYVIYGVSYPVICPSVLVLLLQVQVQVQVRVVMFGGGTNQQNQIRILDRLWKTHERLAARSQKGTGMVLLVSFLISNLVMKWLPLDQSRRDVKPFNFFRVIRWYFRSNVPVWTIVCFGHKQLADILATVLFISSRIKIKN